MIFDNAIQKFRNTASYGLFTSPDTDSDPNPRMSSFTLQPQWHILHYFGVMIERVLDPIVMTMATEKVGIIAMDGGVHIVTAMENKKY